jgi:putative transposase
VASISPDGPPFVQARLYCGAQAGASIDGQSAALQKALAKYGKPMGFNADQGSQFTCLGFVDVLLEVDIKVSIDDKGRWKSNVSIERMWRSLKYECVYIHAFETGTELRQGPSKCIGYCNAERPCSKLGGPHQMRHTQKICR